MALAASGWSGALAQQGAVAGQVQQVPALPKPVNESTDPALKQFVWRSIGPVSMGGRIDDIAVSDANPAVVLIGYATGGLWRTENNGTTWAPVFDDQPVTSIGDIAFAPSNSDIVYVGTGEPNNRQSSSFGAGVYKSTDAGKTYTYVGLKETQTIARIVVHPKDPDIAYVAALGHLFGANPERGVYKTTDGGKSWVNTKFIDNDTGFTDLVMHPANPNILWAASYQRRRTPWGFNGGGPNSGFWKTTDAGKSWTRVTGNGLPTNPIIGRIGLDISRSKPNVLVAQIEVGPSGGTGAGVNRDGSLVAPGQGRGGGGRGAAATPAPPPDPNQTSGVWRSDDGGKSWRFLNTNNNRPMYYSQVRIDPANDQHVFTLGTQAMRSRDGGTTFQTIASGQTHVDHHALWINPRNGNHLILGNDGGLDVSHDQGDSWEETSTMPTGQFYAVSADMRKPYYVCGGLQDNGSWCGPSAVRNNTGGLITDWYRIGGGDGFYTQNDPRDWTIGYVESQDGNTSRYDLRTGQSRSIRPRGPEAPGAAPAGGRGGTPDPEAPPVVPQGGRGGRGNPAGNIVPPVPPGTNFRFYWNTPFVLSPHDPSTIYLGGDRVFRSTTRGDAWSASPDVTSNVGRNDRPIMGIDGAGPMASKHDGAASYSNVVTIGESPVSPGVVWAGTNDGNVQVSRDAGATFSNVTATIQGIPKETHVSRVEPSHFDAATAYVSFDGHRTDDHTPYVYVTRDFGGTWTAIAGNLPTGNVNVVREDVKNRQLLYAGTEYGVFVSQNGGREWTPFMTGLPTVRVDDLMIHPRDNDLIAGTHGRSIWIVDDLTPLQQMTEQVTAADAHLFAVRPATAWVADITLNRGLLGRKHFFAPNPPRGASISYFLKSAATGDVKISIIDNTGRVVREIDGTKLAGLNRVQWNLAPTPVPTTTGGRGGRGGGRGGPPPFVGGQSVDAGTYTVKLAVGGKELMTPVVVEPDAAR